MSEGEHAVSRRAFLTAGAGAGLVAGAATADAQNQTTIDMNDNLRFDPDSVTVAPGTTVVWENVGTIGHTVTAYGDRIPDGATYFDSGGFDTEEAARSGYPTGTLNGGDTFEHTFETEGTFDYFCIPHEAAGMLGTVEVSSGGGGDAAGPSLPDSALTLGVATVMALLSVLALAFFFLKYGGDYDVE